MTFRVLVIDDSDLVRQRLMSMLESIPGVEAVGSVGTAAEGIALTAETRPHLVILDVRMPGRSGIEAIPDLRSAAPGCEVVIFTNYPYRQAQERCKRLGVEHFLRKAEGLPVLREIVRDAAEKSTRENPE